MSWSWRRLTPGPRVNRMRRTKEQYKMTQKVDGTYPSPPIFSDTCTDVLEISDSTITTIVLYFSVAGIKLDLLQSFVRHVYIGSCS